MKQLLSLRALLILIVVAFFGAIIWSMFFETLLPLIRAERWLELLANLFGLPIILAGTAIMLWGFWVFLRDMSGSNGQAPQPVSPQQRKAAQREALARMKPGLLRLVGGLLLIAAGSVIGTLG